MAAFLLFVVNKRKKSPGDIIQISYKGSSVLRLPSTPSMGLTAFYLVRGDDGGVGDGS
jgi:hypothetical protein